MKWLRLFKRRAVGERQVKEPEGRARSADRRAARTPAPRPSVEPEETARPRVNSRNELSRTIEPESTSSRKDSIESREVSNESRRDSTRVEPVSTNYRRDSIESSSRRRPPASASSSAALLQLDERERFALGVGYGSFQSTLNEIRDRVARIQEALAARGKSTTIYKVLYK